MSERTNPSEFARPHRDGELTPFISLLLRGGTLSFEQSESAFGEMASGLSHHAEMGAFLALLASRVPTVDELAGAATVMRRNVDRLEHSIDPSVVLDTAGTGGAPKSFNVSTGAAIVAASCGAKVAKCGNRSRTGRGSAEVLQALGVNVDAARPVQRRCLEHVGLCFCFAIHHHPAARHAMPVRKALGFPTIFNLLGPLGNPAGAQRQLMGVYDRRFLLPIAEALRVLGTKRAIVIHSKDGLDELSTGAGNWIADAAGCCVHESEVSAADLDLEQGDPMALAPTSVEGAADLLLGTLTGRVRGLARSMLILNSAMALVAAGVAGSMREGADLAARSLDSGAAANTLNDLVTTSRG